MDEIWKKVKDFEGLYEVSNLGNVKSLARQSENKGSFSGVINIKEKILKQTTNRLGYKVITLFKNKQRHFKIVHRLVAESFLHNNKNYKEVNHIDSDKSNNKASNLEWCNRSQNILHFYESKKTSSKYRGVSFQKDRNKWTAYIRFLDKNLNLGRFDSEEKAHNYRLNFLKQLKQINYEELI